MRVAAGWKTSRAVEVLVVEDRERLAVGEASQAWLRDKYVERHLAVSGQDGCKAPRRRLVIIP